MPDGWERSTGRLNNKMLRSHLPSQAKDCMICIYGPLTIEQATKDEHWTLSTTRPVSDLELGALATMGWDSSIQLVIFLDGRLNHPDRQLDMHVHCAKTVGT